MTRLAALLLVFGTLLNAPGAIAINEFLAANTSGLRDADGDTSDWIELHHGGTQNLSTAGYSLTDDADVPDKWPLPVRDVPSGGFVLVFASGKDRRPPAGEWHTNFKLDAAGEYLALNFNGSPVTVFAPSYPAQAANISYGVVNGTFVAMANPTPGAANDPTPAGPSAVAFSPPPGLFTGAVNVTLTTAAPGASIHFTADGSVPTMASPIYASPMSLNATTRLRAVAIQNGRTSGVTGAAWLRTTPELFAYTSPLPLLIMENFNAGTVPQKGVSNNGAGLMERARQSAAWVLIERSGGTAAANAAPQLAGEIGLRGRGNISQTWAQKPYSVKTRDGENIDTSPLGLPANDDWVLYYPDPTSGDFRDPTMLFNTFAYDLSRELGRWAPRFRWVDLFLNEDGGDLALSDRRGVYALTEKVSRGRERLDFSALSVDGSAGGWLLSIDRMDSEPDTGWPAPNGTVRPSFFHTAGPDRVLQTPDDTFPVAGDDLPQHHNAFINFVQPDGEVIQPAQRGAIQNWFVAFEDVLYDDARWRSGPGWRAFADEREIAGGYLLHDFIRHTDALRLSLYPWVGDDRRLRLGPVWDVNFGGYYVQGAPENSLWYRGDQLWLPRFITDPDFKQSVIDLWAEWRRGAFNDARMDAIIDRQAAEITAPLAVAQGLTSEAVWQARLAQMKAWLHGRAAFFDSSFLPVPSFSPSGGIVSRDTIVTISPATHQLWRTGSAADPRASGGVPSAAAVPGNVLGIDHDMRVTARTQSGSDWSAPAVATYALDAVPATAATLVITEIHHHAAPPNAQELAAGFDDADQFEFLELMNTGAQKISLLDVQLSGGITFHFATADLWTLLPRARVVIVKDRVAFSFRYGSALPVAGEFTGNLADEGESVTLRSAGALLRTVTWPAPLADTRRSRTLIAPLTQPDPNIDENWRFSLSTGGTPGSDDSVPFTGSDDAAWQMYAFGTAPDLTLRRDANLWILEFSAPAGHDDAAYLIEQSASLASWQPGTAWTFRGELAPGVRQYSSLAPPRFARLRATRR